MTRKKRILLWLMASLAGLAMLTLAAGILVLRSGWFQEKVRERIVAEAEKATGGKASLEWFGFDWRSLRAEVREFTLRGTENPAQPPLFHADSIQVGITVASIFRRDVYISSLRVVRPEVNILVSPEGKSNLPTPPAARKKGSRLVETILRLAVRRFELRDGYVQYSSERIPLDVSGEDLRAWFVYEAGGPLYRGEVASKRLAIDSRDIEPLLFDMSLSLVARSDRIEIPGARLEMAGSTFLVDGAVEDLAQSPHAVLNVSGEFAIEDLVTPLRLPVHRSGSLKLAGKMVIRSAQDYVLDADTTGKGIGVDVGGIRIQNIGFRSALRFQPGLIELPGLRASALDGSFAGTASIRSYRQFRVEGNVDGFSVGRLTSLRTTKQLPWRGKVTGPVRLTGELSRNPKAPLDVEGRFRINPAPGGIPLSGEVALDYDRPRRQLVFGPSHLETGATRIRFEGDLDRTIRAGLTSADLDDLLPAIALVAENSPKELPVELREGSAAFQGVVEGPWASPQLTGRVELQSFTVAGQKIDSLVSEVEANREQLRFSRAAARQGELRLQGDGRLELDNWRAGPVSAISGQFAFEGASLERLARESGRELPVSGTAAGRFGVQGTVNSPRVEASVVIAKPAAYGESFDRASADVRYEDGLVDVTNGSVEAGKARLQIAGSYRYGASDRRNGRIQFEASGENYRLPQSARIHEFRPDLGGLLAFSITGAASVREGDPRLTSLNGNVTVRDVSLNGNTIGNVRVNASTRGTVLVTQATANLRDSQIRANAEWSLVGTSYGLGELRFSSLRLATLQDVGLLGGAEKDLPVNAVLEGEVGFSGPVLRPADWSAVAKLATVEISPRGDAGLGASEANGITLKNAEPVSLAVNAKGIHIRSAQFTGKQTNLQASGTFAFGTRNPWNLQIEGDMNLEVLTGARPGLLMGGQATVDAGIRGSRGQPQINGRVDLRDASIHLADLPNGVEKANGVIRFDRSRATVEKLTAQTGGGDLSLDGFVGFGGEADVYRLQAKAERVRVRYPEGASTTVNAALNLTGTSTRSVLSGVVTVLRSSFKPRTDLASLLAQSRRPSTPTVTTNEFLRGMQFDIEIETASDAEFQTALTRDLQPEAELRLRGGYTKPVVLGRVTVNQGEIQFFGNKYEINRGEISFFNPAKIEPVVDMDLETRVRGITVNINFSGPINKLNVSYRSDPPLQSTEIIALLTVGRAPISSSALAGAQSSQDPGFLQTGGNTLLGQAIAAPVSSRLQRFFGVSRLKIDPQLTGVDNTPQARLTLEQQISRDITLTYVTNLTRTQQQVVRLQWDMSRNWSVVAIRDENGIFGVDFLYRKRFR